MCTDPESAKDSQVVNVFALSGSAPILDVLRTLMTLTPGVILINVFAEMLIDPKSVKKIDNLTVIFTNLGSVCVKAAHITLMKLSKGHQLSLLFEE